MKMYYSTTKEEVDRVSAVVNMKPPLVHALLERQHTVNDILEMSPEERLVNYLSWHGIHGWVRDILCNAASAGIDLGNYK